jgi:DNA-3-methyladenine glycosylase
MDKTITDPLPQSFYLHSPLTCAHDLLGKLVVHEIAGQRISGIITETEAYDGEEDLACHARSGKTRRNELLYGAPGIAYIYFTYGLHWLLNAVTRPAGEPAAVLIRAVVPLEGIDFIARQREGQPQRLWCNGPAKLTHALGIDGSQHGLPLYDPASPLRIEPGIKIPPDIIHSSPRVGIDYAPEPWRSIPWRLWVSPKDLPLLKA